MIREQNDGGEIRLTAGITLNKCIFPFLIERRQIVIMALGDRFEVDGLSGPGGVVRHDATDPNPRISRYLVQASGRVRVREQLLVELSHNSQETGVAAQADVIL